MPINVGWKYQAKIANGRSGQSRGSALETHRTKQKAAKLSGENRCLYKRFALEWPIMPCWIHAELESEWKRLVESNVGANTSGYDSPTVRLYWRMIEHRKDCNVCRDEETGREMDDFLGMP